MTTTTEKQRTFTGDKLDLLNTLNADPRLDARAFKVIFCIIQHLNAQSKRAIVADETISHKTGIPVRSVIRARNSLREAGWIDWRRTGDANVYSVRDGGIGAVTDRQAILKEERAEKRSARKAARLSHPSRPKADVPPAAEHDVPPMAERDVSPVADIHLHPNTLSITPSYNNRPSAYAEDASDIDFDDRRDALPKESKESGEVGTCFGLPRSSNAERSPRVYRQSPAEAARAWNELRQMHWQTVWSEDELTHWHALLRKGMEADAIVNCAELFLSQNPGDEPTLADFLQDFEFYRMAIISHASRGTRPNHHHAC